MSNFTTWRSLVDGEEIGAIPDSVVHQYNSQDLDLSDNDPVSTWPDEVGEADLSENNSPTFETDAINGEPAVLYNGSDQSHQATNDAEDWVFYTDADSMACLAVIETFNSDQNQGVATTTDDGTGGYFAIDTRRDEQLEWSVSGRDTTRGGTIPSDTGLLVEVNRISGQDTLRIDGNPVASSSEETDSGTPDDPLVVGDRGQDVTGGDPFDGYIGEVVLMENPTESEIDQIRNDMAIRWGISLD